MRIEDDELRDLFRAESDQHLQNLEQGLLSLEANPHDEQTLEEVYRAAHSLKGAAAMIEVTKVEAVVHRFEDVLGTARRGTLVLSPSAIDRLCQALDGARQFCAEAITGEPATVDVGDVLGQLDDKANESMFQTGQAQMPPEAAEASLDDESHQLGPREESESVARSTESTEPNVPPPDTNSRPTTIISDTELRELFKVETNEHLERLEQGLLRLEQNPQDIETLEDVFRAAHSLKGAARMMAISKVEVVAHHFEEALGMARRGTTALTTTVVDRLYQAVDTIRQYCDEAVTGREVVTDPEVVLQRLAGKDPLPNPDAEDLKAATPAVTASSTDFDLSDTSSEIAEVDSAPKSPFGAATREISADELASATTKGEVTVPPNSPSYGIDTIRVPSSKLDALLSQAGELSVTRGRIAHRVTQVEQLLSLWEDWNRESYKIRSLAQNAQRGADRRGLDELPQHSQKDHLRLEQLGRLLKQLESDVQGDDARIDQLSSQLEDGIRSVRMLPLSTLFNLFPRLVRALARRQNKEVEFRVEGGETAADKRILEELKDPLTHMIRNSVDHGIELPDQRESNGKARKATLLLCAYQRGPNVIVEIKDDGAGIDLQAIRRAAVKRSLVTEEQLAQLSDTQILHLIFAPGFSTKSMVTDVSGRGVGMDVVRANLERLRGSIEVDSILGQGTGFRLVLPLTVATRRVLIVSTANYKFAIPVEHVQTTRLVTRAEVFPMQGQATMMLDGEPISVVRLSDVLELPQEESKLTNGSGPARTAKYLECIIIRVEGERFGFVVDELLDEKEVVLKSHGAILCRVRNVSGSTILETGEVCVTLNPHDLVRSALANSVGKLETTLGVEARKRVILLAEDSIVTRTQEKRILESAGFEVITAVDGQDAYHKLGTREFDAVVSDVEMPNLNGLDFTAKIRAQPQYKELPVILVTSLATDEDRKRGMDVGADAYLSKPGFDQRVFLETVKRFA